MREKRPRFYRLVQWLVRRVVFPLYGGIEVRGLEHIPTEGPVILAPIHLSYLDPPLIGCISPRMTWFMAKAELLEPRLLAWLLPKLGTFGVRRGENDSSAVRKALEVLALGDLLILFPEGTRNDGQTIGALQVGLAMLAKKSGAWVVPVGLAGPERMWPRGKAFPTRGRCRVVFGEPITYMGTVQAGSERENRIRFVRELERRIVRATHEAGLPVRTVAETTCQPLSGLDGTSP